MAAQAVGKREQPAPRIGCIFVVLPNETRVKSSCGDQANAAVISTNTLQAQRPAPGQATTVNPPWGRRTDPARRPRLAKRPRAAWS